MAWDHVKKQTENALEAINRPRPYRPLKIRPHVPGHSPMTVRELKGWITSEIFLLGKNSEKLEKMLGFDSRPGKEYLAHGIDIFEFTRPIKAEDFKLGGAYTYLPGGKPWDGIDLYWPPGTGAVQWQLVKYVPCRFVKTIPRSGLFI